MSPRIIVLSDLHIAPPGPLASFHAPAPLARLLADIASMPNASLVLAGDIFDFLQIERPSSFSMSAAPALFQDLLKGIAKDPDRKALLQALASLLRSGVSCTLLPGNHDPELHHPKARDILLQALELPASAPLSFHLDDAPWSTSIGRLDVLVGHGHRCDAWNDIHPQALSRALEAEELPLTLPPGSRLVTEVLNVFKKSVDPLSSKPRFAFLDMLKPEVPAVPLLLWYLDPMLANAHFGSALDLGVATLLRGLSRRLSKGPVLGAQGVPSPGQDSLSDACAQALFEELSPSEREAVDATLRSTQLWLEGHAPAAPGTLAAHGGMRRKFARAALRLFSQGGSFFQQDHLSKDDREMIRAHLPSGPGPRVGIFGHTHAARSVKLDGERSYINTGTWMDLMKMPTMKEPNELEAWIDDLEAGRVARTRVLSYAEIGIDGAFLRFCKED